MGHWTGMVTVIVVFDLLPVRIRVILIYSVEVAHVQRDL